MTQVTDTTAVHAKNRYAAEKPAHEEVNQTSEPVSVFGQEYSQTRYEEMRSENDVPVLSKTEIAEPKTAPKAKKEKKGFFKLFFSERDVRTMTFTSFVVGPLMGFLGGLFTHEAVAAIDPKRYLDSSSSPGFEPQRTSKLAQKAGNIVFVAATAITIIKMINDMCKEYKPKSEATV